MITNDIDCNAQYSSCIYPSNLPEEEPWSWYINILCRPFSQPTLGQAYLWHTFGIWGSEVFAHLRDYSTGAGGIQMQFRKEGNQTRKKLSLVRPHADPVLPF
jgi:hypothetical protein